MCKGHILMGLLLAGALDAAGQERLVPVSFSPAGTSSNRSASSAYRLTLLTPESRLALARPKELMPERYPFPGSGSLKGRPAAAAAKLALSMPLRSGPARVVPAYFDSRRLCPLTPVKTQFHNHSSLVESAVDYVETPFLQQTRVPLAVVWRGRVQLGGFDRTRQMENLLLGLPGSGNLAAWGVSRQTHPGTWVPRGEESYGLSLTVHLGRDVQPANRVQPLRCLGWVVGRGCRLN